MTMPSCKSGHCLTCGAARPNTTTYGDEHRRAEKWLLEESCQHQIEPNKWWMHTMTPKALPLSGDSFQLCFFRRAAITGDMSNPVFTTHWCSTSGERAEV